MISCLGVGPGDPGFLTCRGVKLLESAEVVAGFTAVVDLVRQFVRPEAQIVTMGYGDQVEKLAQVAAQHQSGKRCLVVFMGDIHFSGFQYLERVEQACGHPVETVPGISSAQLMASRGRVCFDDTTFITFHRRGDLQPFRQHLQQSLLSGRNAIIIPRPFDFMPAAIAADLISSGISAGHQAEVWENLSGDESAWKGELGQLTGDFSDLSIMLVRALGKTESTSIPRAEILSTRTSLPEGVRDPLASLELFGQDYSIVLAGHGSPDPDGLREFEALVALMQARAPRRKISHGYLECASPTIAEAVSASIAAGFRRVVVVPALLTAARHARHDIPSLIQALRQEYPAATIKYGSTIGLDPALLRLCRQRIVECLSGINSVCGAADTALVLVGRGSFDAAANAEIARLARLLQEELAMAASLVCFAGAAQPLVEQGLSMAAGLGLPRLVVLPLLLFDGVLAKRVQAATERLGKEHPQLEVLAAAHLGVHALLADIFLARARQCNEDVCPPALPAGADGAFLLAALTNSPASNSLSADSAPLVSSAAITQALSDSHLYPQSTADAMPAGDRTHPIEIESMRIINNACDFSHLSPAVRRLAERLVHASGDLSAADNLFVSENAVASGIEALRACRVIITDVTMVASGLNRRLLAELGIEVFCNVHETETRKLSSLSGLTRSAAGIRRARRRFDQGVLLAIGDAPSALSEAVRLISETGWRPGLVVGLPVGFVGTEEAKRSLQECSCVSRITNSGPRGGSPWAAAVVNAIMLQAGSRTEVLL